jgi:hypothetical protein
MSFYTVLHYILNEIGGTCSTHGWDEKQKVKIKDIPVTGRGGLQICKTSMISRFLDNKLIDGGQVISLMRRPPFTLREFPGIHLLET